MPEELWAAAAAVAREQGLCSVSRALGVNCESLVLRCTPNGGRSLHPGWRGSPPRGVFRSGALPWVGTVERLWDAQAGPRGRPRRAMTGPPTRASLGSLEPSNMAIRGMEAELGT